ncbi:MAG: putative Ig domain-containing protein [Proteobacteria bacterium]|nr:putative Ig domain-containing protein [Pseudomonadota bacterium]
MKVRPLLFALACLVASLGSLAAWSRSDGGCAAGSTSIKIDFEPRILGLQLGEERTVRPTMTPERCRGSVHLSVRGGSLPPGMSLNADGDVSGTPSAEGTYRFRLGANGTDRTSGNLLPQAPVSNEMTLVVVRFFPEED